MIRPTQHERILNLLKSYNGNWVPLPKILDLHISQYGRVIHDLRHGKHKKTFYDIENKTQWIGGVEHSWFRLAKEEPGRPANEETLADNYQKQEEAMNFKAVGKQLSFI